ncbi:MAG: mannose-6-phosphate isomerase, partial [Synechococcaceae cyanobacterium SM2_3_1]|nr:mannose-6-phosphate isomerase [Synechococcaceae cyanobacterium SM2_3_1]
MHTTNESDIENTMPSSALYPLLMQRKLVSRIWGGQRVANWLDLPQPYPAHLAETWEVYDTNPIRNGDLVGQTLAQVTQEYGAQLIGTRPLERYGYDFPLLTKFIDAYDHLSIQVHPNDDYA